MNQFARAGLRTLVFGVRELDVPSEYDALLQQLQSARCRIGPNRAEQLSQAYSRIERDMRLIGVSGVEDKLQPGVKRCLHSLMEAGIQVIFVVILLEWRLKEVAIFFPLGAFALYYR